MPEGGSNVLVAVKRFVRSRSRSPGGSTRKGGYGSPLGLLPLETSPIDESQKTPKLFNTLIKQLLPHIATEGLFRVCPQTRTLQQLKAKVEVNRLDNNVDPHVLAALLKAWMRDLPQGLIPPPFQERLLLSVDVDDIRPAIMALPELNKATLNLLFNFLNSVSLETANRMNAGALAVVVGPSLFRVQATNEGLRTTNKTNEIAHKFIKHYSIFRTEFSSGASISNGIDSPVSARTENQDGAAKNITINEKNGPANSSSNTPPPSPSTLNAENIAKHVESSIDRLLGSHFEGSTERLLGSHSEGSTDLDSPRATGGSEIKDHKRLVLPAHSVPSRGSRQKPSRPRLSDRDSHSSVSTGNEAMDVYDRLQEGESLEGWRHYPAPRKSTETTATGITPQIPAEVAQSPIAEIRPGTPSDRTAILPPKLDFSSLMSNSPTSPLVRKKALRRVPADAVSIQESDLAINNTTTIENTPIKCGSMQNLSVVADSPTNGPMVPKVINNVRLSKERREKPRKPASETDNSKDNKIRGRSRNRDDHVEDLKNAVRELEKRMNEKRSVSERTELIADMSELQLREEKSELQRELLILEGNFGRPAAGPERQAVRLIYHRYRELKRKLSRLDNRSATDHEAFLREVEYELSRIERERREIGKNIKTWEAQFRIEHKRHPTNDEKTHLDYGRYRHLKTRRNFLQELQQQKAPESFTV